MVEEPYATESVLQRLLAEYPVRARSVAHTRSSDPDLQVDRAVRS